LQLPKRLLSDPVPNTSVDPELKINNGHSNLVLYLESNRSETDTYNPLKH